MSVGGRCPRLNGTKGWTVRMTACLYCVDGEWRVSLAPEVDVTYWHRKGVVIREGWSYRSIAWAMRDMRQLQERGARFERNVGKWHVQRLAVKDRNGPSEFPTDKRYPRLEGQMDADSWRHCVTLWDEWRPLLVGRSLLLHEVRRLLAARWEAAHDRHLAVRLGMSLIETSPPLPIQWVRRVLQVGVLEREITVASAIRMQGGQAEWMCERCHARRDRLVATACARCGGTCYYCDDCLLLGRSSACEPLLQFAMGATEAAVVEEGSLACRVDIQAGGHPSTLTPAQQRAAEQAVAFVKKGEEPTMLMWAVTGAGKTEMTFDVVLHVLSRGGRVAVASPRRDVVNELTPRFRQAFPSVRLVKLHGESGQTWQDGELVIATTHQLLRRYRAFDLIIVDEVDAFPYSHNESLQAGVRRALKEDGQQLWLTATPPRSWQKAFRRGQLPGVTIPVRYHGHPLPEPKITLERRLWVRVQRKQLIPSMADFFAYVRRVDGQAYVFVPSLSHLSSVLNWINVHAPGVRAAGVFSRDRDREEKIEAYRDKDYDCLVTTTILERGVTVANAHVLILQADHPIFDEAALVQMSGRSGRSASFPSGYVSWIATEHTREQRRALKHIRGMNREARENGWLQ